MSLDIIKGNMYEGTLHDKGEHVKRNIQQKISLFLR